MHARFKVMDSEAKRLLHQLQGLPLLNGSMQYFDKLASDWNPNPCSDADKTQKERSHPADLSCVARPGVSMTT